MQALLQAVASRNLRAARALYRPPDWSDTTPHAATLNLELGWLAVRLHLPLGAEPGSEAGHPDGLHGSGDSGSHDAEMLTGPDVRAERHLQHAVHALQQNRYPAARQALNRAASQRPGTGLTLCILAHLLVVLSLQNLSSQAELTRGQLQALMQRATPAERRAPHLALTLHHHWAGHPVSAQELQALLTELLASGAQRDVTYLAPMGLLVLTLGGYAAWTATLLSGDAPDLACASVRHVACALNGRTGTPHGTHALNGWASSTAALAALLDTDLDAAFGVALDLWQRFPAALTEPLFLRLARHPGALRAGLNALLPSGPGVGSWLDRSAAPANEAAPLHVHVRVLSGEVTLPHQLSTPWPDRAALLLARLEDRTPIRRGDLHDELLPEEPREQLGRLILSLSPALQQHGRTRDRAVQLAPGVQVSSDLSALLSAARAADVTRVLPLLPDTFCALVDRSPWLERMVSHLVVHLVMMAEYLSTAGEPRPDALIAWLHTETRLRPWLLEGLNPHRLHVL